jgi:hypothetical protein
MDMKSWMGVEPTSLPGHTSLHRATGGCAENGRAGGFEDAEIIVKLDGRDGSEVATEVGSEVATEDDSETANDDDATRVDGDEEHAPDSVEIEDLYNTTDQAETAVAQEAEPVVPAPVTEPVVPAPVTKPAEPQGAVATKDGSDSSVEAANNHDSDVVAAKEDHDSDVVATKDATIVTSWLQRKTALIVMSRPQTTTIVTSWLQRKTARIVTSRLQQWRKRLSQ